jgi:hypothetical protein
VTPDDLAHDPQHVLDAVRHGTTMLVERGGRPEAAIVDVVNYRILLAVARFQSDLPTNGDRQGGLTDEAVQRAPEAQARYDLVIGRYLAEAISAARAAGLLGLNPIDLRLRFHRLGVPLRVGPETVEDLMEDVRTAAAVGPTPPSP